MERPDFAAELDRQEADAMVAGDLPALTALWSERLVVTPPAGSPADKTVALQLVERGILAYREVVRIAERVVDPGEVLVSLGSERVIPSTGEALHRRFTHVWVREAEGWKLVVRHASTPT